MKQYLLSIYQPDGDPPPPEVLGPIMERVDGWQRELREAGAWVFTGRLFPASTATTVRADQDDLLIVDGPYPEGKEHLGGFTLIRAADLDAAMEWAGKLARVLPLAIEVRPVVDGD